MLPREPAGASNFEIEPGCSKANDEME